jgi:competence protein ComEC
VLICTVAVFFIWQPLRAQPHDVLTVSFLDVGQGDAIFIESPTGRQVLIDGGRDRGVLRELGEVMPWGDRTIDVIIPTHPDADHIGGLIDVFDRYHVDVVIQTGVEGNTDLWRALEMTIDVEGSENVVAVRGQVVDLGGGASIHILFPDRPLPGIEANAGSTIAHLVYGDTSFMLTGDSPKAIEKYLIQLEDDALQSDVLKVGHHGSQTSSSPEFLDFVSPKYAVFSYGCGNSYGHPHENVVALFANAAIPTLDTCTNGRITFISDGTTVRLK